MAEVEAAVDMVVQDDGQQRSCHDGEEGDLVDAHVRAAVCLGSSS